MGHVIYTKDHEWLRIEDNLVTIGVTEFAQEQLGDVVFIELPEVGSELMAGDEAAGQFCFCFRLLFFLLPNRALQQQMKKHHSFLEQ